MKELKEQDHEAERALSKIYLTPKKCKMQKKPFTTQALFYSQNSSKQFEKFDLSESKPHQNIKQFKNQSKVQSYNSKSNSSNSILPTVKIQYSPLKNYHQMHHQMQIYQFTSSLQKKQQLKFGAFNVSKKEYSYKENVQKIYKKQNYQLQRPLVFKHKPQFVYSKLITFNLNTKNSKLLVFDFKRRTLKTIYKCQYCKSQFSKAAALGGHISKCPMFTQKKELTFRISNKSKRRKPIIKKKKLIQKRRNIIIAKQKDKKIQQKKNILSDNSSQLIVISCSSEQKQNQIKSSQSVAKQSEVRVYNLREKEKIKYAEM